MEKTYDLQELLDKLIGHTDIACETRYDNESSNNLKILKQVGWYVLEKLYDNAKWNNDYRASANYIAKKSIEITKDFQEYINDILNYDYENKEV